MRVHGKMICLWAKVKWYLGMVICIWGYGNQVKKMVTASIYITAMVSIMVNGLTMKWRDMVLCNIMKGIYIKGIGRQE